MNLLITGSNGQLGTELKKLAENIKNWNFFFLDLPDLDITELQEIDDFVKENKINQIINCAAYTAVDLAETNEEVAEKVNVVGAKNLATVAQSNKIGLIHVSTDFVFDGKHYLPYIESDIPNPVSVYGQTKLKGEQEVMAIAPSSIVLRTAWLYSAHGNNFVKTMQKLGNTRENLSVIFDQVGTPTWAFDLANVIITVLVKSEKEALDGGLYHYSNEGSASWYDFAKEIMNLSAINCLVLPIETKDYPTPAARPFYSVLNKGKIKEKLGIQIPHWKESLRDCIEELKNN